jgi:DNA-binding MarR family transcriptional regulator
MKYFNLFKIIFVSIICQYNLPIMKELLYLKDTQIKQLIEKLFTGYRESFADTKRTLDKYSIGIAHHKVLHLLSMYKGITISDLLKKLKVTKQSLNRVLKDLIKLETIFFEKDEQDTRVKHIFLNDKGKKIFEEVFTAQKKRIYNALLDSSSDQVLNFDSVLKKIINE